MNRECVVTGGESAAFLLLGSALKGVAMDDEFDEWDEPKGSCDNCGTNLYADDSDDLCSQCEWFAAQNMNPRGDDQ